MQAYRVEMTIQQHGTVTVQNLPLRVGDAVEVIILVRQADPVSATYSLRGLPVQYDQPTEPVAGHDWDAP